MFMCLKLEYVSKLVCLGYLSSVAFLSISCRSYASAQRQEITLNFDIIKVG